ncbi:MAG: NAD-dependent DNA ligase LigA, partial [Planctomycetota bacterium]
MSQDRITELASEIRRHRDLYYNEQPEISDNEFDALIEELERLDKDHPVLAEVGAPTVDLTESGLPKKQHRIPMGSLDKIPEEKLEAWAEKTGPLFLVQEKYDGISLEVEYEGGRLVDAITRGDGFIGEVVTHNAVQFKNIAPELKGFTGSVRGEVILRLSTFDREFSEQGFANPRNTVSGLVRKKHGDRSLNRHFEILYYDVLSQNVEFATEKEKMFYLRDELKLALAESYFDQSLDGVREVYTQYAGDGDSTGKRAEIDYEIDGLVVRSDSLELQRKLGSRRNRPRYAMAYKFASEGKTTQLLAVDWSMGLGSRVTPVARLAPVPIAGVTVSNATLHNVDYVRDLGVRIGDEVYVERRGDVIPQVMRVAKGGDGEFPEPPAECPSCSDGLEMDGKFLQCPNAECPAKAYGDVMKWIRELEIDSLGEKWVRILIDSDLVEKPADLYALTVESLLPLDRMGKTLASKIVQNIQATRTPPLDRFIAALNIPSFSRSRMQFLIDAQVNTFDKLLALKAEEIAEIHRFGDILAKDIVEGLEQRAEKIQSLKDAGVWPEDAPLIEVNEDDEDGPLEGKSYCFTGAVQRVNEETGKRYTRKQLQEMVVQFGGKAAKDVRKGVDYLVMVDANSTSSKAKKARELGTEVLSEDAFFEQLAALATE